MKSTIKLVGIIALFTALVFGFTTCDDGNSGIDLSGSISISPDTGVIAGTELTATYTGAETVAYQWKRGNTTVGTNFNKYTPDQNGIYTVTVSADGYNSKTSNSVSVTGGSTGGGTEPTEYLSITINRSGSDSDNFLFSVASVEGATKYETRKTNNEGQPTGGTIGSWSGTNATVTSADLSSTATKLSAQAVDGSSKVLDEAFLPGMVKYPTSESYAAVNDLVSFLQGALNSLYYTAGTNGVTMSNDNKSFRSDINKGYYTPTDEADATNNYKNDDIFKNNVNTAMNQIFAYWPQIWADLNTPDAATDLGRVMNALPALWFNSKDSEALKEMMDEQYYIKLDTELLPIIKAAYPAVVSVYDGD